MSEVYSFHQPDEKDYQIIEKILIEEGDFSLLTGMKPTEANITGYVKDLRHKDISIVCFDNRNVGYVAFKQHLNEAYEADIYICKAHRNQGHGKAALDILSGLLLNGYGDKHADHIEAICQVDNTAMIKALEGAGFRMVRGGQDDPLIYYLKDYEDNLYERNACLFINDDHEDERKYDAFLKETDEEQEEYWKKTFRMNKPE